MGALSHNRSSVMSVCPLIVHVTKEQMPNAPSHNRSPNVCLLIVHVTKGHVLGAPSHNRSPVLMCVG